MKYRIALVSITLASVLATFGCGVPRHHNLPPAQMLHEPGPGVGGPGPGVFSPELGPMMPGPGAQMLGGYGGGQQPTSQIAFVGLEGMVVRWNAGQPGAFDSEPLVAPGRQNFPQGAIYRLKLTNIPGHEGVELYPTVEVGYANPRTEAYLAHNPIPVQFIPEDFSQVLAGNFVTKVIYLPDSEFQQLAQATAETLISTRLEPGIDPIVEADRRGSIMAIIRLGGKDEELPGAVAGGGAAAGGGQGILPVSYLQPAAGGGGGPVPYTPPMTSHLGGPPTWPTGHVAGVTSPSYGMPITGTPIGLPGPPHVPLGVPAGLQKHSIKNHTSVHMPEPTRKLAIHVKQKPGMSYPKPPKRAFILEWARRPWTLFTQPFGGRHQLVP